MSSKKTILGTVEAWESGELGESEQHVRVANEALSSQIDDSLGLQAISIRLPKSTIEAYKNLAAIYKVGYQPLMRDAIVRWADSEMKILLAGAVESQRASAQELEPRHKKAA